MDSFDNENTPNEVVELASVDPSRRQSHQSGPGSPTPATQIEPYSRRISGQGSTRRISGQVELFSRRVSDQGGSALTILTQMGSGPSRRVAALTGTGSSRRVSAQIDPSTEPTSSQKGSVRRLMALRVDWPSSLRSLPSWQRLSSCAHY